MGFWAGWLVGFGVGVLVALIVQTLFVAVWIVAFQRHIEEGVLEDVRRDFKTALGAALRGLYINVFIARKKFLDFRTRVMDGEQHPEVYEDREKKDLDANEWQDRPPSWGDDTEDEEDWWKK